MFIFKVENFWWISWGFLSVVLGVLDGSEKLIVIIKGGDEG